MELPKFELNYTKIQPLDLELLQKQYLENEAEDRYQPFNIKKFQAYNPIYSLFFEMNSQNYNKISFNHKNHIVDLDTIYNRVDNETETKPIFIKFAPLLDPVKYLIGKYKSVNPELLRVLPSISDEEVHPKLSCKHNASYVDNFFCFLASQLYQNHNFTNSIDYYGSALGIQEKFRFNAADDHDYLIQSDYFNESRNKMYEIDEVENPFANFGSRTNKHKIQILDSEELVIDDILEAIDLDIEDLDSNSIREETTIREETQPIIDQPTTELIEHQPTTELIEHQPTTELIEEDKQICYEKSSTSSSNSTNSSDNSDINYSDDEAESVDQEEGDVEEGDVEEGDVEEEDESGDNESGDDESGEDNDESASEEDTDIQEEEPKLLSYIYDFPIQMICLEKCKGTLDELFAKNKMDEEMAIAAIFQVIFTLLAYQKTFHFTHNDLHTNNIMYIDTDKEFLFYKYDDQIYKVPTYGKIYKIIDFGRAIYKYQGKTFCSDSFATSGDAATQYNFEPFFNDKKPRLEPNYAFDLCRLGCSIFDFVLDETDNLKTQNLDIFQKLILDWVTDDNGHNILYKSNGDERYPNFKLYKMIARTVHKHTPAKQFANPIFQEFILTDEDEIVDMAFDEDANIIDLDVLPCYA